MKKRVISETDLINLAKEVGPWPTINKVSDHAYQITVPPDHRIIANENFVKQIFSTTPKK